MNYEAMEGIGPERTYCIEDGKIIGIEIICGFAWEQPFSNLADCVAWMG